MSHSIQTAGSNAALIPVFNGTIGGEVIQLCCARVLHSFMSVKRDFSNWIKARISKFGFVEGADYLLAKKSEQLPSGTKYSIDYYLTLDMAKELSMVENNAKGREARRYFIACERKALKAAAICHPQGDSIDVAALLLSGQSEPKPLTPAQHALIDQAAGRLIGEAYPLIRAHLERHVSWNTNAAQRQSGDVEVVQQALSAATLGNCLAHHLHSEAQAVRLLLQTMRQRIDGVLGSYEQPLGLAH